MALFGLLARRRYHGAADDADTGSTSVLFHTQSDQVPTPGDDNGTDPGSVYEGYVAAVNSRDVDGVLSRMSEGYGRGLRAWRSEPKFTAYFDLWCGNYLRHVRIVSCVFEGDKAILETVGEIDGLAMPGRVALMRSGNVWQVSSERCSDGRTRMPAGTVRRWR